MFESYLYYNKDYKVRLDNNYSTLPFTHGPHFNQFTYHQKTINFIIERILTIP